MSKRNEKGADKAPEPTAQETTQPVETTPEPNATEPPSPDGAAAAPGEGDEGEVPDGAKVPAPPPKSLGDIARVDIRREKEAARAAETAARRAERASLEARAQAIKDSADRLKSKLESRRIKGRPSPRVYIADPDSTRNVVLRGRCFRSGECFIGYPDEDGIKNLLDAGLILEF